MSLRYLVVGLGNIGTKRRKVLGPRCVASVDPLNPQADYRHIEEVPTDYYDAAVLSVPNQWKLELLHQLLATGKHVLVEKPLLFPDAAASETAQALALETGAVWYTSYQHRFEPLIRRLKCLQEEGAIGTVYNARLVYGNGTVQDCIGTWREAGYGVLEDLGSHLIDLTDFLFGHPYGDYILWQASRYESRVLDQCVFATADRKVVLECATTMWKNLFTIDIYGQLGSLHLRGLCKWGPSKLLIHRRVFPSGVPEEVRETVNQEDQTWAADFVEFERRIERRQTSRLSDWRISACLHSLAQQATHLD